MTDSWRTDVARALLEVGAAGFSPDRPITFKSGLVSPVYIDNRRLPFYPDQWHLVIEAFQMLIQARSIEVDIIAGVAVGGVPHSAALAFAMRKPSVFVRKEAKAHGTQRLVEGGDVRSKRVLLVEDLVTTGSSSLEAVSRLREAGAAVEDVLAIVGYGFEEAERAFEAAGVRLVTLTDFDEIARTGLLMGRFTPADLAIIQDWLSDPPGWVSRREQL